MKFTLSSLLILILLSFLFTLRNLYSQESNIKWGEINKSDLEMKSYPADTNASAVILYDYGESQFNNELDLEYNRHLRIKILTTKGFEWATHSVDIYSDKDTEEIEEIEGVTYSINDKGEIVKNKLKSKDIFEEEINDEWTRYKFTLPGLTPGCIIEIKYKIVSNSWWFIRDWRFQYSEPVLWSEYCVLTPNAIGYASVVSGYERFYIFDETDTTQIFMGSAKSYFGKNIVSCRQRRWVVKDAPAIRDEAFMTTRDDYISKVDLQLTGYAKPGFGTEDVLSDWKGLVNELSERKDFGEMIEVSKKVRQKAEEITIGLTTPEEKLRAIYYWVTNCVVCSGTNRIVAEKDCDEVIESKSGTNADITFLFLSLLKSIGINGDPVILSTRNNGKIQELFPIVKQFNYVLARVIVGNTSYFVDATNHFRSIDLLPEKVLYVKGLVIKKDAVEWVVLTSEKRYIKNSFADLQIKKDGTITGVVEYLFSEYGSLNFRNEFSSKKDIEIAKKLLEPEQSEIIIDSVRISGIDSLHMPVKLRIWVSLNNYAQINNDIIYMNPYIIERFKDNPLKTNNRRFPIDYSYKASYTNVINITIPDSLEINGQFNNQTLSVANGIQFTSRTQFDKNKIQIFNKLEIKQMEIKPQYYLQLKEFYSKLVAAQAEQLVIKPKDKALDIIQNENLKN